MLTRRAFFHTTGTAGIAALAAFAPDGVARIQAAGRRVENVAPMEQLVSNAIARPRL